MSINHKLVLGIDFGTNSARALAVDIESGKEVATSVANYPSGINGILLDPSNPLLARQFPGDYHYALEKSLQFLLARCEQKGYRRKNVVSIATDATGSTPIPVDKKLQPVAFKKKFRLNLNAQAWLWKDHTSAEEAKEITELIFQRQPEILAKCGGAYSSEWFFSKIFRCSKIDEAVFQNTYTWVELSDYIPALLCGINDADAIKRNICAAGHKAMFNSKWGGLPGKKLLGELSPSMANLRDTLYEKTFDISSEAGKLSRSWAKKLGLKEGIPVAVGIIDAHVGAIGSGVREGTLVKILGTSSCDIMVHPIDSPLEDIPGVAGIVPNSVLPGFIGIEAGQSAVGDIFNWFISTLLEKKQNHHLKLSRDAAELKPGQSGLLALDWNNGNRNILTDPNLSGLLVGQTLQTTSHEVYRALIESTAFGALTIVNQIEKHGVKIKSIINCGGISQKNPLVMQIYADILNRPMRVTKSPETVALGAAVVAAHIGMKDSEEFNSIEKVQDRLCELKQTVYTPAKENNDVYKQLYTLYKKLHDSFGIANKKIELHTVMKKLFEIKNSTN